MSPIQTPVIVVQHISVMKHLWHQQQGRLGSADLQCPLANCKAAMAMMEPLRATNVPLSTLILHSLMLCDVTLYYITISYDITLCQPAADTLRHRRTHRKSTK